MKTVTYLFTFLLLVTAAKSRAGTSERMTAGLFSFNVDQKTFAVLQKPDQPTGMIEGRFVHRDNPAFKLLVLGMRLQDTDVQKIKTLPPSVNLRQLAGQISRSNSEIKLEPVKKTGLFIHSYFSGSSPSGQPFNMFIAQAVKQNLLLYMVYGYERERDATAGQAFNRTTMQKSFEAILASTR